MRKDKIAPYLFFPSPAAERDGKKKQKTKNKTDRDLFLSAPLLLLACRQLTPWLRQRCSCSSPAGCRQLSPSGSLPALLLPWPVS